MGSTSLENRELPVTPLTYKHWKHTDKRLIMFKKENTSGKHKKLESAHEFQNVRAPRTSPWGRTNGTVLCPLGLQVFFAFVGFFLVIPFAVTQG